MEVNNWVDLGLYTLYTIGVLFIVLPLGARCLYVGARALFVWKIIKFEKESNVRIYAGTSIELLISGTFAVVASAWYLFIDSGGHIIQYPVTAIKFISGA